MSEDLNYFILKLDKKMLKMWNSSLIIIGIGILIIFLSEQRLGVFILGLGIGILVAWGVINNKIETLQEKL